MKYLEKFLVNNWDFLGGSEDKVSACNSGDRGSIPGLGNPHEEGMATYSNIPAWRIPQTEEPGKPQSKCSQSDRAEQLTLSCFPSTSSR